MIIFYSVVILFLVAIVLWNVLTSGRKNVDGDKEDPNADKLFDAATGEYYTLEDAEKGRVVDESAEPRIMSDEEIEAHYVDENKEEQYIIRESITRNFQDCEDERIYTLLETSEVFTAAQAFHFNYLWRIKDNDFLGIAQIDSHYGSWEKQLYGIVQGDSFFDQLKDVDAICFQRMGETIIFRLARKVRVEDFKMLLAMMNAK